MRMISAMKTEYNELSILQSVESNKDVLDNE